MKDREELREDFEFLKERVKGVLLFGSAARGDTTSRSDIDICLVEPETDDILLEVYKEVGDKYDVKIFEKLPLTVQINIIEDHKVIIGDPVEISYHFYKYRKRWKDIKPRIEEYSFDSTTEMIETRRKWLDEKRKISQ